MRREKKEKFYESLLSLSAGVSLLALLLISVFVFIEGYPIIGHTKGIGFLFGLNWSPSNGEFGVFPMLVGSILVTMGALILGVPFSLLTAIFLAEYAPRRVLAIINPAIELLAGIPSVIYGLFGMTVIVPAIRSLELAINAQRGITQPASGFSLLAATIILSIMISPTIINIAKDSLQAVPHELKEGSLALGATQWQTIERVLFPMAKSGILAGVILGMGRAIGETMAVIMVAGNTPLIPTSIFSSIRTLTSNIAIEISYAAQGPHTQALFGSGIVLFFLIVILNAIALKVAAKGGQR